METTVPNDLPIDDDDVVEVGKGNSGPWPQANKAFFITLMDEEHAGVGWDIQRLTITAPDDIWEALYKVTSHAKRYRKKGMVYYHELSRILGDTSATGKLAHLSTKSSSESNASSDPEFKVKNEDLDALQIDSDNDNGDGQGKGKGKSNMTVTNVGDDSGPIEGGSTTSRSLLKECMALLHVMEEILTPTYTKVVNKLALDPIIREVFVDMSASKMRDWVLNL
ncbi:hypothetical protein CsSME_00008964 [Camellia sinensis var. sinensis]